MLYQQNGREEEQQGRLQASSTQPAFGGGCKVLFDFHYLLFSPWMSFLKG
jgi:hypothetical protein